jgi:hypothetical protein
LVLRGIAVGASPIVLIRIQTTGSDGSPAGHEIEDEHDDGENQKDMNPSSQRVAADESQDPEDEENDRDCPKHFCSPTRLPDFAFPVRSMCSTDPQVISCRTRRVGCQWE